MDSIKTHVDILVDRQIEGTLAEKFPYQPVPFTYVVNAARNLSARTRAKQYKGRNHTDTLEIIGVLVENRVTQNIICALEIFEQQFDGNARDRNVVGEYLMQLLFEKFPVILTQKEIELVAQLADIDSDDERFTTQAGVPANSMLLHGMTAFIRDSEGVRVVPRQQAH
jgi:hypothetical protein